MRRFPFNQPDKTRDCGYRCLYYVVAPKVSRGKKEQLETYEHWLDRFRYFAPIKSGILFNDICTILDYYKIDHRFTQISDRGLFIVYSGFWLHHEGKKHGHYFVYHDGVVYCSTHAEPYALPLSEVIRRLEAKTLDHAFRVLRIDGIK